MSDDWVRGSERRRRATILRWIGLVVAAACPVLVRATLPSGVTLAAVVMGCLVVTVVAIDFAVRPKLTPQGTGFLTLTPLGVVTGGTLQVTDATKALPGRLTIGPTGFAWTSRRSGSLAWARAEVESVSVRRVASPGPLGSLTVRSATGTFTTRIFQPRDIAESLRTSGYDVSSS